MQTYWRARHNPSEIPNGIDVTGHASTPKGPDHDTRRNGDYWHSKGHTQKRVQQSHHDAVPARSDQEESPGFPNAVTRGMR